MKKILATLAIASTLSACGSPSPQEKFNQAFVDSQTSETGEGNEKGNFSLSMGYEILDDEMIKNIPRELTTAFGNISASWDFTKENKERALLRSQLKFNSTAESDFSLRGEIKDKQISYMIENISYPFMQFIGMGESFTSEEFDNIKSNFIGQESIFPISEEDFSGIIASLKNAKTDAGISNLSAEEDEDIIQEFINQNVIQITEEKQSGDLDALAFEVNIENFYNFLNAIGGEFPITEEDKNSLQIYGDMYMQGEDFQRITGEIFIGEKLTKDYGYENILAEFDYDVANKNLEITLLDTKNNQEVAKIHFNWKK